MSYSVNQIGDGAFIPGTFSETYVPDQLIAGSFHLVTQPIVLAGDAALPRGSVLGQQTSFSVQVASGTANVGNGTIASGSVSAVNYAEVGAYTLTASGATTFYVASPEGAVMPNATVGTAYSASGIAFTVTAGGTAFVAGDKFTLTVIDSIGNFILSVKTATDGSQTPNAILCDWTTPVSGAVRCGAYLSGEFNANAINFDPSWTPELLATALRPYSIYLKTVVSATDPGTPTNPAG